MRRFNILFAFAAILLSSCISDEVDYVGYQPSSKGGIHIIGAVEDYDVKSVGTRADDGDIADSYISEMTMFIFKSNGDLIQGYTDATFATECTSAINIQRGNPTFLIDTEEGILADLSGTSDSSVVYYDNNADDLGACDIYIVANAWHQLSAGTVGSRPVDAIKKLSDLEAFVYQVDDKLAMPMIDAEHHRGFPMIGKQQGGSFKLKKGDDNEGNAVATIPLKKLYSKVRFTMQINADQVVAGQTPKFTISKVEVFNVPKKVRMGRTLDANSKPVYGDTEADDYLTEMGVESTTTPDEYYHFCSDTTAYVINSFNKRTISHSTSLTTDDVIEFSFYMPEHKVTPNAIQLPSSMTPDEREKYAQYYKPTGVGAVRNGDGTTTLAKIATFVRIHGSYTDHNGQILGVSYDIYLGQNNSDDFTIKRNQLLNNKLIITGLTNHKDAYPDAEGNISIDHRVEVSDRGFNLSMERTAILDAHFEVRPLDIELQAGASMTVTIPVEYRDWVAMEDDAVAYGNTSGLYVNTTTARKGVRKYFTTDLVKELNAAPSQGTTGNGGTLFFENTTKETKTFRIWFYIDENPNVYDKTGATTPNGGTGGYTVSKEQYRVCPVQFVYNYEKKDENDKVVEVITKTETINFQQWNLWRVWAKDANGNPVRYYDIEHEEEYLNNYASDLQYGQTQDGMPWGLEGVQLSHIHDAAVLHTEDADWLVSLINIFGYIFSGGSWTVNSYYNGAFSQLENKPFYDYYLSDDTSESGLITHDYKGYEFNAEIAATLKNNYANQQVAHANTNGNLAQIEKLNLTQSPSSAFAYCYHKNKRNDEGVVVNQKWFLPAIDEIEDIALGAYDEFNKVFQNEKYWSCQPAYDMVSLSMPIRIITSKDRGTLTADYYVDDLDRARATSVYVTSSLSYQTILSGVPGYAATQHGVANNATITLGEYEEHTLDFNNELSQGNLPRTESCRIRAVYRSGTK